MDELIYYNARGNSEDKKHSTAFAYLSSLHTTKTYHQYRQCPSNPNSSFQLSIGNESHLIVALPDKPVLHVYLYGKESPEQFIPLPEILTSLTIYDKNLVLGGSVSGRLYIWSLNSGLLLNAKQSHYQPLTHIATYGGLVATGSKDSRVVIHSINSLLDPNSEEAPSIINDHTLPISSLNFNKGLNNDIKLMTSSLDSTVRVYSLTNLKKIELLTTIISNHPVTALTVDPAFRIIFVGLSNGNIRSIPLFNVNPVSKVVEPVGGLGKIVSLKEDADLLSTFTCHSDLPDAHITQMKLSFDNTLLVSGDNKGRVFVIDINTKQIRKKMKELVGEITNIQLFNTNTSDIDEKNIERNSTNNVLNDKLIKRTIPVLKRSIVEEKDLANQSFLLRIKAKDTEKLFANPLDQFDAWISNTQEEEKAFTNFTNVDTVANKSTELIFNADKSAIKDLKADLQSRTDEYNALKEKYDELLSEYTSAISK